MGQERSETKRTRKDANALAKGEANVQARSNVPAALPDADARKQAERAERNPGKAAIRLDAFLMPTDVTQLKVWHALAAHKRTSLFAEVPQVQKAHEGSGTALPYLQGKRIHRFRRRVGSHRTAEQGRQTHGRKECAASL